MTYTRLSYNSNNWENPSGPIGKSRNRGVHEYDYGFGFEEWLFSKNHFLLDKNGEKCCYGYLEGINKNYTEGDENEPLVLFTINNNLHQRFIVGEIKIWQPINEIESANLIQQNPELIETMREQVAESTNNNVVALEKFDFHRDNQNGHQLFNIKFKQISFIFNTNNPVNNNHVINRFNRFWLYRN